MFTSKKVNSKNAAALIRKIDQNSARVGVIGLGYVGLPLSMVMVKAGFRVTGFDISKDKVKLLNSGKSDIDDISSSEVKAAVKSGKFKATTDPSLLSKVDTISICVPTPLSKTKDPDVSYILSAMEWVVKYMARGTMSAVRSRSGGSSKVKTLSR